MKVYNAQARERIDHAVLAVEDHIEDGTTLQPKFLGTQPWTWWVLAEDLDSTTHEAPAHPLEWYVKRNSGAGEYAQDISFFTVRDTLENSGAKAGSVVLCRPIGSENGTVLEIVFAVDSPGRSRRCSAILTVDAGPGATVNVDNVVPLDGGISPLDDPDDATETLSATMPPDARALDNATCIIEWDENGDAWEITWVHQKARRCTCQLQGALAEGDEYITVDNISPTDGGQSPGSSVTAYNQRNPSNTGGFEGDDNAVSKIELDVANDTYHLYDVPCTA